MASDSNSYKLVELNEARSFIERCMVSLGTKPVHAATLAEALVTADHRGHFSHGMNRLDMYTDCLQKGTTVSDKEPVIVKETVATGYVDGNNILGPVVGKFCMQLAIEKAKEAGIGWVVANGSNHYSIAGWYSTMALENGFLGMSFTNASPSVVPTRGKKVIVQQFAVIFVLIMKTKWPALLKVHCQHKKLNFGGERS
ncbi:ureidoglycolate dehydrogenase (NAD(+))-like [Ptychodera flava]|uniref:ureidoglycolate dehydrogenase (NAD(+))-like n=1 Tax=Ptychodera flava TaxID=63121 RepID=UPI00396A4DE0